MGMYTPSSLYMLLMIMLAQGMLSGAQGHQIAVAAKKDLEGSASGHTFSDLERLAQLQRGPRSGRNCGGRR